MYASQNILPVITCSIAELFRISVRRLGIGLTVKYQNFCFPDGTRSRLFDTGGELPVVLLVHGLANSIEIWEPLVSRMRTKFRVIAFDLPGFGEADRPDVDYGLEYFSRQLSAFVEQMNIHDFNLVGYSLGGSIAIRFASQYPERLKKLVIAAPGGFGRKTHWTMRLPSLPLVGALLGYPSRLNTRLTLKLAIHDPVKITAELSTTMIRHAARAGSWKSYLRTLRQGVGLWGVKGRQSAIVNASLIKSQVLLVWGDQDRVFPLQHSQRLLDTLPRAELKIFESCGHYPHWEFPQLFADTVIAHFSESPL